MAAEKAKASHPTFFQMAKEALTELAEKSGSSVPKIQSFIVDKYQLDPDSVRTHLKPALAKGLENETFVRPKNSEAKGYTGRFKLNKAKELEAAKQKKEKEKAQKAKEKAKLEKKPAAKTSAKKTPTKSPKKKTAAKSKKSPKKTTAAKAKAKASPSKKKAKAVTKTSKDKLKTPKKVTKKVTAAKTPKSTSK